MEKPDGNRRAKGRAGTTEKSKSSLEPVTVRIPGEAKWKLELMARQDHRSTSAVFEWCIEVAARLMDVDAPSGLTIASLAKITWDLGPVDQALELHGLAPSLMDYQARAIVDMLKISPELFTASADVMARDAAQLRAKGGIPSEMIDELERMDLGHYVNSELIEQNLDRFLELVNERHKSVDRKPITRADLDPDLQGPKKVKA